MPLKIKYFFIVIFRKYFYLIISVMSGQLYFSEFHFAILTDCINSNLFKLFPFKKLIASEIFSFDFPSSIAIVYFLYLVPITEFSRIEIYIYTDFIKSKIPFLYQRSLHKQFSSNIMSFPSFGHKRNMSMPTFQHVPKPIFKKSNIKKLNLHHLKIQAEDLCQQNQDDIKKEKNLIQALKLNEIQQSQDEEKQTKRLFFKRQTKISTQVDKVSRNIVKQQCNSLFSQGFLPQVKKFYRTYKNLEKQKDKINLIRHTVHESAEKKNPLNDSFGKKQDFSAVQCQNPKLRTIHLASNINQGGILPKKLGLMGLDPRQKIDQKNAHLTKNELKTISRGLLLTTPKNLSLQNNKLSKQTSSLLFSNLPPQLQKINLKHCLSNSFLSLLQSSNCNQLKHLNLSQNKITDNGLGIIQPVLLGNSNLEVLNLGGNLITDSGVVARVVGKSHEIKSISLKWNKLKAKGLARLFETVERSISLLNLDLSRNQIGQGLREAAKLGNQLKPWQKTKNIKQPNPPQPNQYNPLKSLCSMLKNNQYLLHLDLSHNGIAPQQSQRIAQCFNIFNQTLVGLHFEGNSNYSLNSLGYLVEKTQQGNFGDNLKYSQNQRQKGNNESQPFKELDLNEKRYFSINDPCMRESFHNRNTQGKKAFNSNLPKVDKCWMCHRWTNAQFNLQLPRSRLQTISRLRHSQNSNSFPSQTSPLTQQSHQTALPPVYIHLSCHNYQPLLMSVSPQTKLTLKQLILQQDDPEVTNKRSKHHSKTKPAILLAPESQLFKAESFNTITYCDNLSSTTIKPTERQEVVGYEVKAKVPEGERVRYFFSVDGEVLLDDKREKLKLETGEKRITFEAYDPFRMEIAKMMGQIMQMKKNVQISSLSHFPQICQTLISLTTKFPFLSSSPQCYTDLLFQTNIFIPEQPTCHDCVPLHSLYKKLLNNEQLTKAQYNLLIDERTKTLNDLGSDKFISSAKLIKEKYLRTYSEQNQNPSQAPVRPRDKRLLVNGERCDEAEGKIQFEGMTQLLKDLVQVMDEIVLNPFSQSNLSFLSNVITKMSKLKSNPSYKKILFPEKSTPSPASPFYPCNPQLNSLNMYLNFIHASKQYNLNKININTFTGEIISMGGFVKENQKDTSSHKSLAFREGHETRLLIENETKSRLAIVAPYILIHYNLIKSEDEVQNTPNSTPKQKQGIFNMLQKNIQKSQKKSRRESKQTSINSPSKQSSSSKSSQKNTPYKINIKQPNQARNQSKFLKQHQSTIQDRRQGSSNINSELSEKTYDNIPLDFGREDDLVSAISMRLVQELLDSQQQFQPNIQAIRTSRLCSLSVEQNQLQLQFAQKLTAWKTNHPFTLDNEEKYILKLVSREIQSSLESLFAKPSTKPPIKPSSKKGNKFNLKVNKFCSLESNTYDSLSPISFEIPQKKRPTFNIEGKDVGLIGDQECEDRNVDTFEAIRNKTLEKKLKAVNLSQEVELFLMFDHLFTTSFSELHVQDSIHTYMKKIDKFLTKQQRNHNRSQILQASSTVPKAPIIRKPAQPTLKQKTSKDIKRLTTNKSFLKLSQKDNKKADFHVYEQRLKLPNRNIFSFLSQQRQNSGKYFSSVQTYLPSFLPLAEAERPFNLTQQLLNRFQYISINLVKNFGISKQFKSNQIPSQAKQILLKELNLYKKFLFNCSSLDFSEQIDKFLDIYKPNSEYEKIKNPELLSKIKAYSFNQVVALLEEYLLFTIFLLAKHQCFQTMFKNYEKTKEKSLQGVGNTTLSPKLTQDLKESKSNDKTARKSKTKDKKDKLAQPTAMNPKPINPKQKQKQSFLDCLKSQSPQLTDELKKLMKESVNELILTITKLHIRYDQQLKRTSLRQSQKLGKSQKMKEKSKKKVSQNSDQGIRSKRVTSSTSSKAVSVENQVIDGLQNKIYLENPGKEKLKSQDGTEKPQSKTVRPPQKRLKLSSIKQRRTQVTK